MTLLISLLNVVFTDLFVQKIPSKHPCIPRRDITVAESNPYPCHKTHQRRGGLTIKQAPSSLAEHKQWGTGGLAGGGGASKGKNSKS